MPHVTGPQWDFDVHEMSVKEFWLNTSEDILIELISIAAESLQKDPQFHRYTEHPVNKSEKLLEEEYDKYCRPVIKVPDADREPLYGELQERVYPDLVSGLGMLRARANNAGKPKTANVIIPPDQLA